MNKKPNILFFFTDDQRFDTIAALGNEDVHTPNLDKLTERGTSFTRAHIPGGTCGAVCMPSRAMLHSGRTLFHLDGCGEDIPDSHVLLGECLQNAGYDSFGTGKWHNGRRSYARSFNCGDEIFFGGMGDHWNVPAYRFDPSGRYEAETPFVENPHSSNKVDYRGCDHINAGKHSTKLFVDASVDFLKKRGEAAPPFFMYVSLMAPHDPRTMPDKFLKMYDPEDIKLPENFLHQHPIDTGALKIRDEVLADIPRDTEEIRRHIAEYYAMISHLDAEFGRLIKTLRHSGDLENTIIVFAGDNGLAVGQHGLLGKQNLYEHSVRVPLIFAGPGIPEGEKCEGLVYLLDVYPTLCQLTGIEAPGSVAGRDMTGCFRNPGTTIRKELYLAYAETIRGITDGEYKLIEYACDATQLFDLKADPLEMQNLANHEGYAEKLSEMRSRLVRMAGEWEDQKHATGRQFWRGQYDTRPKRVIRCIS